MKRLLSSVAAATLALGFSGAAVALTVTEHSSAPTSWADAMAATPNSVAVPGTWTTAPSTRLGNLAGDYRSPFDTENAGSSDTTLRDSEEYFAVGPGNATGTAIMTFTVKQNSLSFLWGSVDTYNTLKFYLAGVLQDQVTDFSWASQLTYGASYVTITGVTFDEIQFGSPNTDAFEFSNLSSTAVPIPAAVWLLGSGLLGLFAVGRRGRPAAS